MYDVAAAVGLEAFILDGPMWTSAYGNWLVPDQTRFPNGLKPLGDYAHKKGLLFGAYFETEGSRDGFTSPSRDGDRASRLASGKRARPTRSIQNGFRQD
jgi:hypothetical protein